MVLSVILDLTEDNYCYITDPKSILVNLHIFLNTYLTLSHDNVIYIINNQTTIFDSNLHSLTELMAKIRPQATFSLAQDFGYSLLHYRSARVFIMNVSPVQCITNLIKCSFVAEKLGIRIDALSLTPCSVLSQVCYTNNGIYDETGSMEFFLSMLWSEKVVKKSNYGIVCLCHEKMVEYGLICPVCLSVYCKFVPICRKCKTKMSFLK